MAYGHEPHPMGPDPNASAYPAPPPPPIKRPPADEVHPFEPPAKKQSKWSAEENELIIRLRGDGMKWDDVSKHLPGRSAISCRLHYQNFLERRPDWDEEKKNKLARLYERFRREMWERVARELRMPWRAAEDMHWVLGKAELAQRAGVQPFLAAPDATHAQSVPGIPITTSFVPLPTTSPAHPLYATSPHTTQAMAYSQPPAPHPGYTYQGPQPGLQGYPMPYQGPPPDTRYGSPGPPPQPYAQKQQQQQYPQPLPQSPHHSYAPAIAPNPAQPSQRPRRSVSSTTQPPPTQLQAMNQPYARASPPKSPRRRALSTSRLVGPSSGYGPGIPPIERRTPPSPPPPLPSLPREYFSSNPQGAPEEEGQKLPPVRYLTEESVASDGSGRSAKGSVTSAPQGQRMTPPQSSEAGSATSAATSAPVPRTEQIKQEDTKRR